MPKGSARGGSQGAPRGRGIWRMQSAHAIVSGVAAGSVVHRPLVSVPVGCACSSGCALGVAACLSGARAAASGGWAGRDPAYSPASSRSRRAPTLPLLPACTSLFRPEDAPSHPR